MRPCAASSGLAIASLLLALSPPGPAFAQAGGMPILVAPSAGAMAGLLLLPVIPLALMLSQSDAKRLRVLDAREDWDGMTALASRRLAAHPGDPVWHEVRGRALQRQARCADAVDDLRLAFESRTEQPALQPGTLFDTGMLLGLCQMAVQDFAAAAPTMERLAAVAPERWEPSYHLGVIRAQQGDMDAARAVLPVLRARSEAMADSLQTYLAAMTRARSQPAAISDPASQPGFLPAGRLSVGTIALDLPSGWAWFQAPESQRTVRGGQLRSAVSNTTQVRVVTVRAYAMRHDGSLAAAVAFSTNPQQAFGTSYWYVDDPCGAPATVYRHRFSRTPDRPECADVRIVEPAGASADLWGAAHAAAAAAGSDWKDRAYELHYAAFGLDRVVEVTVQVPMYYFPGEMAAAQWVHALAAQLKPLARRPSNRSATVPALVAPR